MSALTGQSLANRPTSKFPRYREKWKNLRISLSSSAICVGLRRKLGRQRRIYRTSKQGTSGEAQGMTSIVTITTRISTLALGGHS
jgi:hypothetical protein